jgi:hypothetical protein
MSVERNNKVQTRVLSKPKMWLSGKIGKTHIPQTKNELVTHIRDEEALSSGRHRSLGIWAEMLFIDYGNNTST